MMTEHRETGARSARFLFALAGLMMAAGIGMAAVAAHAGAGREIGVASTVLLANAPMIAGATLAVKIGFIGRRLGLFGIVLGFLGALLFTADMVSRGFGHGALFEYAAPIGGSTDILAWILVAIAAVIG
jgi:uncharacterized membrane protein YgdD (TMEM256/DUF423 family)